MFISWSCSSKAAVLFRWRLFAVIARSCWAPLMLLPLAFKTWTKGWALSLFSLISIETGTMWPKQLDSVAVETPPLLSPPSVQVGHPLLLPPLHSACLLLIILFSILGGPLRGGRCRAFYTVCNKLWVVTQNQRVCILSADHHWKCVRGSKEELHYS